MTEYEEMLSEYVQPSTNVRKGTPITKASLPNVVEHLKKEERLSCGIIKNDTIIRFLEGWFS